MSKKHLLPKVLALVGATGSGKTDLSIKLAKYYNAVIINLDSVQIYKELNIGSAKPSLEELNTIKHYLINTASIYNPQNSFSIFEQSYKLIQELHSHTNIILTGGSGLYYKNLLWGMFKTPSSSPEYRAKLRTRSPQSLWEELQKKDLKVCEKLHPNDTVRIERALEVLYVTGKSIEDLKQEQTYTPPADFLLLGISYPRPVLYDRINKRVLEMINDGLVKELENLIQNKEEIPPLLYKVIGYKELIPYLKKEQTLEEVIPIIQQNTRRYAKKQLTLFRHIPNIHWFDEPKIKDIITYIESKLLSDSKI